MNFSAQVLEFMAFLMEATLAENDVTLQDFTGSCSTSRVRVSQHYTCEQSWVRQARPMRPHGPRAQRRSVISSAVTVEPTGSTPSACARIGTTSSPQLLTFYLCAI